MRPRYALARRKVKQLLLEANIVAPPVPVEQLAERMGALVRYAPFDGQMSGLLRSLRSSKYCSFVSFGSVVYCSSAGLPHSHSLHTRTHRFSFSRRGRK